MIGGTAGRFHLRMPRQEANGMRTRTIRQAVTVRASPGKAYQALLDSRTHAELTGAGAHIGRSVGSAFFAHDGWVTGFQLKLVHGKKIVQLWRGKDWPKGHYSIATFTFSKAGKGARISLKQEHVPAKHAAAIAKGWKEFYWEPMQRHFR